METVVLVIHLMLVAAMIGIILMQRSEGGALGIGGGGNFMAARGTGNVLTRATTILAAGFFITSIVLTFIARNDDGNTGLFDNLPAEQVIDGGNAERPEGGVLNLLGGGTPEPAVPDEAGGVSVPDEAGGAPEAGAVEVPNEAGSESGGGAAPVEIPQ